MAESSLPQNPTVQTMVLVQALSDTSEKSLTDLKNIIATIDPSMPLWRKCRMILALKELQPHKAFDIAGEGDFLEEDKFEVSVILQCALETINILSQQQEDVSQTHGSPTITPFFFTTSVQPLSDSTSNSTSGSGSDSPVSFSMSPDSAPTPTPISSLRALAKPFSRTPFTPIQISKMEAFFETVSSHPSNAQIEMLAAEFGRGDSKSVKIWFKNKRAKKARLDKKSEAFRQFTGNN